MNPNDAATARAQCLDHARLYFVTDARRHISGNNPKALVELARTVAHHGVDIIQLRDKNSPGEAQFGPLDAKEELEFLLALKEGVADLDVLVATNDRADIAYAAGVDVCHTGQRDLPIDAVRDITGDGVILGKSCNNPDQVARANVDDRIDYFCTGPIWATPTKPGRKPCGVELVQYAAALKTVKPWFAIGGINTANIRDVVAAGARRVVVVRAIADAADPGAAAAFLKEAVVSRD